MQDPSQPETEIPLEEGESGAVPTSPRRLIDEAEFRAGLGHFASGITVITGNSQAGPAGFTCQSFFSASLEPPMVGICPSRSSTSWPLIADSGRFCVNFLADQQETLARSFARSGSDKFAGVGWTANDYGPRLKDSLGWIDCQVGQIHDAGDHLLVLGEVHELEIAKGQPLIFYRGGFGGFTS